MVFNMGEPNYSFVTRLEGGISQCHILDLQNERKAIERLYAVKQQRNWVLFMKPEGKRPVPIRAIGFPLDGSSVYPITALNEEAGRRVETLERELLDSRA